MKLVRFKLTDTKPFRSLHPGFEYVFRTEWSMQEEGAFAPFVCAGPNGSGKSNMLEVLAAVFFHLDCRVRDDRPVFFDYDEERFPHGYREEICIPDAFELEYLARPSVTFPLLEGQQFPHVRVVKSIGTGPQVFLLNGKEHDPSMPLDRKDTSDVLPQYVVGYSSGENEILSLPFFKARFMQFDSYLQDLNNEVRYSLAMPESRMIFLDQEFNQAILLSLFLLGEEYDLRPFADVVGLERVQSFRIVLQDKSLSVGFGTEEIEEQNDQAGISGSDTSGAGAAKSILASLRGVSNGERETYGVIEKLQYCATAAFSTTEENANGEQVTTYYFDYWVDAECKKAFKLHFGSALELFRVFQVLLTLNLYPVSRKLKTDLYHSSSLYINEIVPRLPSDLRIARFVDVTFKKKGISEYISSKCLSDGENQFLHTLGLCTLYQRNDVLFLLDEPETHFNPEWRAQFITQIKRCLPEQGGIVAGVYRVGEPHLEYGYYDMLITTHTPFLISDSIPEKVLVFASSEGQVHISQPDYNTFGASINKITMKTFGKQETIGAQGMNVLYNLHTRLQEGESKEVIAKELNKTLGDSVEKMFFMNALQANDSRE